MDQPSPGELGTLCAEAECQNLAFAYRSRKPVVRSAASCSGMITTQLQPDILVYSAKHGRAKQWREISDHWLAVEVLSRSSRISDRDFKRDAYFALGVSEVWLVDIEARAVEVSRAARTVETVRDVIRWCPLGSDEIRAIDLAELFHVLD